MTSSVADLCVVIHAYTGTYNGNCKESYARPLLQNNLSTVLVVVCSGKKFGLQSILGNTDALCQGNNTRVLLYRPELPNRTTEDKQKRYLTRPDASSITQSKV